LAAIGVSPQVSFRIGVSLFHWVVTENVVRSTVLFFLPSHPRGYFYFLTLAENKGHLPQLSSVGEGVNLFFPAVVLIEELLSFSCAGSPHDQQASPLFFPCCGRASSRAFFAGLEELLCPLFP